MVGIEHNPPETKKPDVELIEEVGFDEGILEALTGLVDEKPPTEKGEGEATIEEKGEGKATIEMIPGSEEKEAVDEDKKGVALALRRSRHEVQALLSKTETKSGICGRCDWVRGCDRCDVSKALRKMLVDDLMSSEPRKRGRPSKA